MVVLVVVGVVVVVVIGVVVVVVIGVVVVVVVVVIGVVVMVVVVGLKSKEIYLYFEEDMTYDIYYQK